MKIPWVVWGGPNSELSRKKRIMVIRRILLSLQMGCAQHPTTLSLACRAILDAHLIKSIQMSYRHDRNGFGKNLMSPSKKYVHCRTYFQPIHVKSRKRKISQTLNTLKIAVFQNPTKFSRKRYDSWNFCNWWCFNRIIAFRISSDHAIVFSIFRQACWYM